VALCAKSDSGVLDVLYVLRKQQTNTIYPVETFFSIKVVKLWFVRPRGKSDGTSVEDSLTLSGLNLTT